MFLARQLYPENSTILYKAYLNATQRPYGYLILDLSQDSNDLLRFRTNIFPTNPPPPIIYALRVLKTAEPRLRKVIVSNCKKDLVNILSECVLNVLNGNIKLTGFSKRKLRKHNAALRKVADKRVPLSSKKKFIVQRGGFLLPLLSAVLPTIASLIFKPSYKDKGKKKQNVT